MPRLGIPGQWCPFPYELDAAPLARVVSTGAHAVDPQYYGIAPVAAVEKALKRGGKSWADLVTLELNEDQRDLRHALRVVDAFASAHPARTAVRSLSCGRNLIVMVPAQSDEES